MLIALVPAHNEAATITQCIDALLSQTRPPDRIIVIADNCTDNTAELVQAHPSSSDSKVELFITKNNNHKKAGALNQALHTLLPGFTQDQISQTYIFVQDADSILDSEFLSNALAHLETKPYSSQLGAIGGVFRGSPDRGFVPHLQRNEYARYARDVDRLKGKCLVVTGTAALFRASTLAEISAARLAGKLPAGDGVGGVYDTTVLTEDNEISFALLHLGYKIMSPGDCTLETEVMPTWRDLYKQRLRWKRGAVENCFQYGLTRYTLPYWGRQLLTFLGVMVTFIYLGTLILSLALTQSISIAPFWLAITGIFVVERIVTVRYRGWKHMLLAATMYELILDLFLQIVHAQAYFDALTHRKRAW